MFQIVKSSTLTATCDRFNILAYSTTVDKWHPNLQLMTKKCGQDIDAKGTSESAIEWISRLKVGGSSYLLQALKVRKKIKCTR